MQVPGRAGYSIIGDESIEFYRTPRDYLDKRRRNHGNVFLGRILNKPTVFMTSNRAVQDLLREQWQNFSLGYKEYMLELFEENLVFLEGDAWYDMRRSLEDVFSRDSVTRSMEQTKHVIQEFLSNLDTGEPIMVYRLLKTLCTRLSIALFLGHDVGPEDAEEISELMTTHWRGIISIPKDMKGPWSMWRSGYSKAISAKERLLAIITERIKSNPSVIASGVKDKVDNESGLRHLLLFISALVPKAFAALLTSAVVELSKPENAKWRGCSDDAALDDVLLEVQRLWPPFIGGRRVCTQDCQVAGFLIPKGMSVVYCSFHANRDAAIFCEPHVFKPERWTQKNSSDREKVWTFGGGPRQCVGLYLCNTVLKETLREVVSHYTWDLVPGQDLTYKFLPVCRPKEDVKVIFTRNPSDSS